MRHFHVVVLQRRQRNVQNWVMHVQSCCFANLKLFWWQIIPYNGSLFLKQIISNPQPYIWVKPRANGRNTVGQQLPTLLDVTCCFLLHTLLHVVGCCCVLLRKVWNRSNFSANNFHDRRSVAQQCWTALSTLLGPRTLITHGLQRLMGCILMGRILPTMHCRSQHCWELLPLLHTTANKSQAFFVATAPRDGAPLRSSQNKLFTIIGQRNND